MSGRITIALVGDSDISRWPAELLPAIQPGEGSDDHFSHFVSGHSGATLDQILSHVQDILVELHDQHASILLKATTFIIACAGENDIGEGIPLVETEKSFQSLLDLFHVANAETSKHNNRSITHLIYLGPKFEPWLSNDPEARKSYMLMSRAFERLCRQSDNHNANTHLQKDFIRFIDCLTMFCGASANQPGAVLGGKAIPEKKYFANDQLHLSDEGYMMWKSVLEKTILQLL
jgi:lysophospholipase L1-like esterase